MKTKKIKTSVLVPSLTALIAGIIIMIVIVSLLASSSTNNLTDRLISARVNEYANKFEAISTDGYAMVRTLAPIVEDMVIEAERNGDIQYLRDDVITILKSALASDDTLLAVWTCWEPNEFDGRDGEHINHDE